jgi:hypothetical protein
LLKKRHPRRFQLAASRRMSAACSGNQTLACLIFDAAHPCGAWQSFFNELLAGRFGFRFDLGHGRAAVGHRGRRDSLWRTRRGLRRMGPFFVSDDRVLDRRAFPGLVFG